MPKPPPITPIQWCELHPVDKTIVATSPEIQGNMELPHRLVIRDLGDQYVVHMQIYEKGRTYFHAGIYFPKKDDPSPNASLKKAWACFERRTRVALGVGEPDD
jgi:hypothetical protein